MDLSRKGRVPKVRPMGRPWRRSEKRKRWRRGRRGREEKKMVSSTLSFVCHAEES